MLSKGERASVCRKQRKYKEEDYARRAVDVLPGSPEVQSTLKDALKKAQ